MSEHAAAKASARRAFAMEQLQHVQTYTGRFKLPEPDEETRALVKRIVEWEMSSD